MKNTLRILCAILALALLVSLLTGCGKAPGKLPADDKYHPETDWAYGLEGESRQHTVAPTDEQAVLYADTEGCVFRSQAPEKGADIGVSFQSTAFCTAGNTNGTALVVSADTDCPDAACKLIEILNCDLYTGTTMRLGEEGADWTMDADGQAVIRRDLGMWGSGMPGDVTNCVIPATEAADYAAQLEACMANAVISENIGFRLDGKRVIGGTWNVNDFLGRFRIKILKPYLGMGSGLELYEKSESGGPAVSAGYDIHVGYLLDCTQEEQERQYSAFSGLLKSNHAETYEAKPICAEIQRQLDAWRAGR